MNRIVIIGNGFDLAHKLKTSYRDFINDYWEQIKKETLLTKRKKSVESTFVLHYYEYDSPEIYIKSPETFNGEPNQYGYAWFKYLKTHSDVTVSIKNAFLETISEAMHQNWVDIEEAYYIELTKCLENKRNGGVEILNNEFLEIKTALEKYLKTISQKVVVENDYYQYFNKELPGNEKPVDHLIVLSFNYTSTANRYAGRDAQIIHIHGKIEDPNNPIIFGYGDEIDERSKLLENQRENEYLKYTKSIEYLKTGNYKKLQAFMEENEYEIFVVGHSCGISDRTLLNILFEHKHCNRIKVFCHKRDNDTDNYNDLLYNIYRIFTDKKAMLNRVVKGTLLA